MSFNTDIDSTETLSKDFESSSNFQAQSLGSHPGFFAHAADDGAGAIFNYTTPVSDTFDIGTGIKFGESSTAASIGFSFKF